MRGKKIGEEQKEQLRSALMVNPEASSNDLAKIVNIPGRTIRDLLPEIKQSDEYSQVRQQKKEEFINKAWDLVTKTMLKMDEKLETMTTEEIKKVNIRDLAVAMGTVYDKQALANGEPTQITESSKPINELIKDYDKKLEQYKKIVAG